MNKDNNLNTDSIEGSMPSSVPDGLMVPCTKRERNIFTKWQYENIIGQLIDNTSKVGKPLYKNSRLFIAVKFILDEFCRASNGGRLSTEINQCTLVTKKIKGVVPNFKTIRRAIKFLKHHDFLRVQVPAKKKEHATYYVGGVAMFENLTAEKLKVDEYTKHVKKYSETMKHAGLDPLDKKTCGHCMNEFHLYNFELHESSGRVRLLPVCKGCNAKYRYVDNRPATFKNAFRVFHDEIKYDEDIAISEHYTKQIEREVLEKSVRQLGL